MNIEIIKATLDQKPILANLLELYSYDFTKFCNFNIGDDGFYGYKYLSLYWTDSNRWPYLIYCDNKISGFVLVKKCSPGSDDTTVWDIAEFFIMRKYKRQGLGTAVATQIWQQFKGAWQVRVLLENKIAYQFWLQTIKKFISAEPTQTKQTINGNQWTVFSFKSKDRG